jgi:PST family polysaccharide transporter
MRGPLKPFHADGAFQGAAEPSQLRRIAVRGAGAAIFGQGLTLAVQVVATVILARLLAPADFGLVAMVTTFSTLLMSFGVNGFTEATIQREQMDDFIASNLFWINLAVGLVLTGGFAAAGPLLTHFYRDPLVAQVTLGISPTILIANSSYLHQALLMRAMRFSAVSVNQVVARAVSAAVSIVCAWAGLGYWALVAGAIALPLSTSIGAWWLCRWVPRRPRRVAGTGSLMQFAVNVYGRFSIRYCIRNMDNLLVGLRFQAATLGFYKKAYDLFAMSADQLVSPLANVALATLSRLTSDPAQYKRYLTKSLGMVAFVGMAICADLTLVGAHVIRLLLGPKWEAAGRIFTFFGPGIGFMLLHSISGWIHLSIGKPSRWLRWTAVEWALTAVLFVLALRWGPEGIAGAWSASFCILTVPAFWYAGRPIEFGIASFLQPVWRYAAASLLAGCAAAWSIRGVPSLFAPATAQAAFAGLVVISALFTVLYLGAVILLHSGCAPLHQLVSLLRDIAPPTRCASTQPTVAVSQAR